MKNDWINKVDVRGYVFSHDLREKVTGPTSKNPGTKFISGTVNIATDNEGLNVVPVSFTYVTETFKNGNANETFKMLQTIINDCPTYQKVKTDAMRVRISGNIETNDFVTREGEIASPKRVRGGFIHPEIGNIAEVGCSKFETDMLISNYATVENNDGTTYGRLKGYVFDFRNSFLPIELTIRLEAGMDFFEAKDISSSNPLLTKVKGEIVSTTIEHRVEEESAFGAPSVNITTRTLRAWDVNWVAAEEYEYGDEGTMTLDDVKKGIADRETYLAGVRKRHEDYQKSRETANSGFSPVNATSAVAAVEEDDFRF